MRPTRLGCWIGYPIQRPQLKIQDKELPLTDFAMFRTNQACATLLMLE